MSEENTVDMKHIMVPSIRLEPIIFQNFSIQYYQQRNTMFDQKKKKTSWLKDESLKKNLTMFLYNTTALSRPYVEQEFTTRDNAFLAGVLLFMVMLIILSLAVYSEVTRTKIKEKVHEKRQVDDMNILEEFVPSPPQHHQFSLSTDAAWLPYQFDMSQPFNTNQRLPNLKNVGLHSYRLDHNQQAIQRTNSTTTAIETSAERKSTSGNECSSGSDVVFRNFRPIAVVASDDSNVIIEMR